MPSASKPTPAEQVRAILEAAQHPLARADDRPESDSGEGEPGTGPAPDDEGIDPETVAWCAGLDHSDTDNARRLKAHFGQDLRVIRQRGGKSALFAVWNDIFWNTETGNHNALAIAQRLGGRIALEAPHLVFTLDEQRAVDAAAPALAKAKAERTDDDKVLIEAAGAAAKELKKRRGRRMSHAVTSKNKGKLDAALACLVPHVLVEADAFNPDPLKVATAGHTLAFERSRVAAPNPAFADPDNSCEEVSEKIEKMSARVVATKGHRRDDMISRILPTAYDAAARCPRWDAFLVEVQPDEQVRRLVRSSFGLGLLGITVQRLFFHYGSGANGKSVAMEVICRVLGDHAVMLPSESFFGPAKSSGGASPDIARLHGRRLLRVKELPEGEQLREAMVKELTGGETITARSLFEGYFDFLPVFVAHMSGNAEPYVRDISEGLWRRMTVVPWRVTIPPERRRDMEEFCAELMEEASGILNWLIAGALDFLENGLVIPAAVTSRTADYRADMDPLSGFFGTCLTVTGRHEDAIQMAELYEVYSNWAASTGRSAMNLTRFGKEMKRRADALGYVRDEGRNVWWRGLAVTYRPPHASEAATRYEDHMR